MAVDLLTFPFIGGRTALNFVGTLGKRGTENLERLRTPEDFARWAGLAGLGAVTADATELDAARLLREACYRLLMATMGRATPTRTEVAMVNDCAARETPVPALTIHDGALRRDDPAATATEVLAAVARDGIDLLTGADAASIRECEDLTCTLLFIDTSRSHRRRWCSMGRCGTRAKMRTLRSPHQPGRG